MILTDEEITECWRNQGAWVWPYVRNEPHFWMPVPKEGL